MQIASYTAVGEILSFQSRRVEYIANYIFVIVGMPLVMVFMKA